MKTDTKNKKSLIIRVILIAFAAYLLYSVVSFQVDIARKRETLEELRKQCDEKTIINEELQHTLDLHGSSEFVEQMARDKLGYAYADEHFYVDISGTD